MKNSNLIFVGAGALFLYFMLKGNSAKANDDFFNNLSQFGTDDVNRLRSVAYEIERQGADYDLTLDQIKFMLAQILQETGLFTSNPNYHAVDELHNFAGISSNGSLRAYNSVSDFVTDYFRVLSLGTNKPIDAQTITQFNQRLKANGYYEDSIVTYGNNLNYYYNLLN